MAISTYINPEGLHRSPAFTQVIRVSGSADTIYVGGQNGVDMTGRLVGTDVASQTRQALLNLQTCLQAAGAGLADIVKWTVLLHQDADADEGYAAFGAFWGMRENPPVITFVRVAGLGVPGALVEIDAIAALPPTDSESGW